MADDTARPREAAGYKSSLGEAGTGVAFGTLFGTSLEAVIAVAVRSVDPGFEGIPSGAGAAFLTALVPMAASYVRHRKHTTGRVLPSIASLLFVTLFLVACISETDRFEGARSDYYAERGSAIELFALESRSPDEFERMEQIDSDARNALMTLQACVEPLEADPCLKVYETSTRLREDAFNAVARGTARMIAFRESGEVTQ